MRALTAASFKSGADEEFVREIEVWCTNTYRLSLASISQYLIQRPSPVLGAANADQAADALNTNLNEDTIIGLHRPSN